MRQFREQDTEACETGGKSEHVCVLKTIRRCFKEELPSSNVADG